MDIFVDDQDHIFFLYRLKENLFPEESEKVPFSLQGRAPSNKGQYTREKLPAGAFSLIAYTLMPNHFHLLIRQNTEVSISKLILKVCTSYSKYFNKKYGRVGGVFQDQFKAVHISNDEQLRWVVDYINNNPVKSGLIKARDQYKWGSLNDVANLCEKMLFLS